MSRTLDYQMMAVQISARLTTGGILAPIQVLVADNATFDNSVKPRTR